MDVYIEITLLPGADVGLYFLWEKVFRQIHKGLTFIKDSKGKVPVGLSFPEYDDEQCSLGKKLRIFADEKKILTELNPERLLSGYQDYVHLTRQRPVPDRKLSYACYKRQQPKSSMERLARRKAKRQGISMAQALDLLQSFKEQRTDIPYINMSSTSSGNRFKLFILRQEVQSPVNNGFSCYGLSTDSTVPEF